MSDTSDYEPDADNSEEETQDENNEEYSSGDSDSEEESQDAEDSEDSDSETNYTVEYAKSNRAQCRITGRAIDKNELRIGRETRDSDMGHRNLEWMSFAAFKANKYRREQLKHYLVKIQDVDARGLKKSDFNKVDKLITELKEEIEETNLRRKRARKQRKAERRSKRKQTEYLWTNLALSVPKERYSDLDVITQTQQGTKRKQEEGDYFESDHKRLRPS
jgi:hypothetical protein